MIQNSLLATTIVCNMQLYASGSILTTKEKQKIYILPSPYKEQRREKKEIKSWLASTFIALD